ncbi:hypothetical protein EZS27_007436 [termite gut metagenome]|uniref:Outer membrane protein beta-barrel domain-containing protein n=1 Tax=termite gut metagenome TaxID=433724 RepID=A0A5J4SGR5_9ZZZZ
MINKDEELWIKKLREKLEDHSEPLPLNGWERLEKNVPAPVTRRLFLYRRIAAVAAILICAVSLISIYLLHTPAVEDMIHTPMQAYVSESLPAVISVNGEPQRVITRILPLPVIVRQQEYPIEQAAVQEDRVEEVSVSDNNPIPKENKKKEVLPLGNNTILIAASAPKQKKWSVGVSVLNSSIGMESTKTETTPVFARIDMLDTQNDPMINIPSEQEVQFKDGIPYISQEQEVVNITHRQPVSFGLSVRKELARGFSIEGGVVYTQLVSDIKKLENMVILTQRLHYVGIPLQINRNMLNIEQFAFYLSAGGMIEKCVSGKSGNEVQNVKPLQFSLLGNVGMQYNVSKHVSAYLEPGVAYFFDDGSEVQTIRKERPLNLNIRVGMRLSY